jgi:hypothetical protein
VPNGVLPSYSPSGSPGPGTEGFLSDRSWADSIMSTTEQLEPD